MKEHHCDECRTPILRGETYTYVSGIWDGRPDSFHFHVACDDARHQYERYVRETREAARARLRLAERPFGSFVGFRPATTEEDRAELKAARDALGAIEYVCDCVPLGELGEALREYALEVLGYDTRTGLPPKPREFLPLYETKGAEA
jgi:hypothetical protein